MIASALLVSNNSDGHEYSMQLRARQLTLCSILFLPLLTSCGGEPDCASADVRASVLKTVSGNTNNALIDYAIKKSDALKTRVSAAKTEADKSAILEKAKQSAVYRLSDTISTSSKSKDRRAVACNATMFATVEGTIVQKQVDFKVDQAPDGKPSVSVSPFQFDPSDD